MSRLLKITDLGSGIMVQGTDNVLFPDNATLTYPYNSIVVVTDESDIATFRSASNNDVLFSGLIGKIEIGGEIVTKENINTKFDAIANKESGGGGGGDVSGLFADASYDSQTKHINFYDKDNTLVAYVDATDFIKDGMVSNVEILNGNLVITFNTDAGKEPITIPLTDIFNSNNYYTKTDANALFATQVVVNEEIAARIAGDNAINTALGTKADKSDTYTKSQIDDALALKQDASTAFSGDYNDLTNKPDLSVYAESADLATVATSGSYDDLSDKPVIPTVPTNVSAFTNDAGYLTEHQSLDNYYTKSEVNAELADKQDKLTAGSNITIENNVISATGGGGVEQIQSDWNQTDDTAVDYIKNKPTIPDTSDFVSKTEYNPKEVAIAEALTQLNDTKADKTELPDVSTLATKTELNAKANTADLATVATSGSYNDLSDKPVIPDTTNLATKSEVEALEPYAVDLDAYVANGITEAQYDEIVQAVSDGRVIKATYGTRDYTVKSVYVDGDVMKISLSDELKHRFFQFGRSTGTVSPTTAEYVSLVEKGVWNAKQAALISGTNIKTVNNQSILGEGNIEIQGGGGGMDEDTELLISSALVDLNDRKIDASEVKENYQKKGDYVTNAKVDTKANISDVPTNTDYEEAQKITSWSLNDLNARLAELEARVAQLES